MCPHFLELWSDLPYLYSFPIVGSIGQFAHDLFVEAVMTCILAVDLPGVVVPVEVQRAYAGPGTQFVTFQVCHMLTLNVSK